MSPHASIAGRRREARAAASDRAAWYSGPAERGGFGAGGGGRVVRWNVVLGAALVVLAPVRAGAAPPCWTCFEMSYDSGGFCNCNCGCWDPDCFDPMQGIVNCSAAEVCLQPGRCGEICLRECNGRDCGASCGDCAAEEVCSPGGVCVGTPAPPTARAATVATTAAAAAAACARRAPAVRPRACARRVAAHPTAARVNAATTAAAGAAARAGAGASATRKGRVSSPSSATCTTTPPPRAKGARAAALPPPAGPAAFPSVLP